MLEPEILKTGDDFGNRMVVRFESSSGATHLGIGYTPGLGNSPGADLVLRGRGRTTSP